MEICLNYNIIKEWNRKNFITNDDLDLICDITVQLNFVEFKQIIKTFLIGTFQISVQDPNEGLSITSNCTGFIFDGFITYIIL